MNYACLIQKNKNSLRQIVLLQPIMQCILHIKKAIIKNNYSNNDNSRLLKNTIFLESKSLANEKTHYMKFFFTKIKTLKFTFLKNLRIHFVTKLSINLLF